MQNHRYLALRAAAEPFCGTLPENWLEMDQPKQLAWISKNKTAQYSTAEPETLLSMIDANAQAVEETIREALSLFNGDARSGQKDSADLMWMAGLI